MIKINQQNYNDTAMIFKGIFAGFFWAFCNVIYDFPSMYCSSPFIIWSYCLMVSLIYFYILKSQSKSQTLSSWLTSLMIAIITWLLLRFLPLNATIYSFAMRNHIDEFVKEHRAPPERRMGVFSCYMIYHSSTALAVILSFVFSKPKKSKETDSL
jgi:hypothetical protein